MSSTDGKAAEGDDPVENSSNNSATQSPVPPMAYAGMPMHMYPFAAGQVASEPLRSKRRQVKNACTNCQKACKKCDDARPCLRCVKYGVSGECVDSRRKERKKGIKRGPYKKRDDRASKDAEQPNGHQQTMSASTSAQPAMAGPSVMPPYAVGFPPGYYGQYAPPNMPKPAEGVQYYVAHPPPHGQPPPLMHGIQEGPPPGFYPTMAYVTPYGPPVGYPSFMVPHPDGQMHVAHPYPSPYSVPMYPKDSAGGPGDMMNDRVRDAQGGPE